MPFPVGPPPWAMLALQRARSSARNRPRPEDAFMPSLSQDMFRDAAAFDQYIGDWDTSKVTAFGMKVCATSPIYSQDLTAMHSRAALSHRGCCPVRVKQADALSCWPASLAMLALQRARSSARNRPWPQDAFMRCVHRITLAGDV